MCAVRFDAPLIGSGKCRCDSAVFKCARANLKTALSHLHLPLPISGASNLTAHIGAKPGGEDLTAVAQVDTVGVDVDNLHLGSLRARLKATKKGVDVEQASWDWADSTI